MIDFIPQRIISLVPSQTELLCDLGLGQNLVGITKFCIYPKIECEKISKVGGTKTFNFHIIDALKPDLIIGNKEENYKEGIEKLSEKYPTWISDIYTFEEALQSIQKIGNLVGKSEKSNQICQQITTRFNALQPKNYPPKVAYLIWNKPIMIAAKNTFIDAMIEKAGFQNAFSDLSRYPCIDIEDLESRAIDYLFLSSEPFYFRQKHIDFYQKKLPNTKVKLVNGEMFSWYGTRLLKSVDYFLTEMIEE
ncbi:MAG: cobalamin-binding protein [Cytophagia bacterium]|nr:MAG: cobalamin-binding protein [Cytophagia bacterium]TAG42857.1 MAG: cobalamin-binding protein [Cytophagia bacterium]TAH29604.1 MAG: cobalamin-binding protein [Cytophagales bacterium]